MRVDENGLNDRKKEGSGKKIKKKKKKKIKKGKRWKSE
jgi:hypothetical protein